MATVIEFQFGDRRFRAELRDTPVARSIASALPLEAEFAFWGDEIYFDCGIAVDPDATKPTVEAGDVAYWPPGQAICLFWGPTPVSAPGEIRPASPVAVFGRLDGDPKGLACVTGRTVVVTMPGEFAGVTTRGNAVVKPAE